MIDERQVQIAVIKDLIWTAETDVRPTALALLDTPDGTELNDCEHAAILMLEATEHLKNYVALLEGRTGMEPGLGKRIKAGT